MDTYITKKILMAAVVIIVLAVAVVLYWTRSQQIRFAENFPDAFEYYVQEGTVKQGNQTIKKGSNEYAVIKSWFEENTDGWKNDIKDYKTDRVLKAKKLTINILKDGVVVNYTLDGKSWSQVSRPKAESDLVF